MGMLRIKLVHLWDKMAHFIPLMDTIKRNLYAIRWTTYERRVRQYKDMAKSSTIEPKILVLMGTGIGNAVESTPFVQAIRVLWPKAEITILVPSRDLFDNWCVVDHIEDSPKALKGRSFNHTFVTWGGCITVCRGYCQLGQIHYTEVGMNLRCAKPEREYNMDMLRRLGYEGPTPLRCVLIQQPKEAIPSSPLRICLVPGSKGKHRRWPYFDQLGWSLLQQHPGAQICIIGTKDDQVPEALVTSQGVVDLRGRFTLGEAAWVLAHSNLAIGNDCGGMHIADAVETRSIVIFGSTCDIKFSPAYKSVSIRQDLSCAPCYYSRRYLTCDNPVCMNELYPDAVLKQANELLTAAKAKDREPDKNDLKPDFPY